MNKLGIPWFEMEIFDEQNDYVLWKWQITNVLDAMSLGKVFSHNLKM